jgi:hypothetical protein
LNNQLRQKCIEAGATAYEGYEFYTGSSDFVPEDAMASALDAILDVLADNADEWWAEASPYDPTADDLLAVLRNGRTDE